VREKLPWLAGALLASWLTVLCQQSIHAIGSMAQFPPGMRVLNALSSYGLYLTKAVWPTHLAAFYPYPAEISWSAAIWGAVLLGLGTWWVLRHAGKAPWAPVGWLWFLGTFVPMIGLVQAGAAARADRYTYLPHLGLYLLLAWGLEAWVVRRPAWKPAILTGLFLVVAIWGALAWRQVGVWRDSETLFQHALRATGPNYLAYNNLGIVAREQGRKDQAEALFRQALAVKPTYAQGWNNLGIEQAETNRLSEAQQSFGRAIEYDPNNAAAWLNLGRTWLTTGDPARAEGYFRQALALNGEMPMAHFHLGLTRRAAGDLPGAAAALRRAVSLQPSEEIRRVHADVMAELASSGAGGKPQTPAVSSPRAAAASAGAGDPLARQHDLEAALAAQPDSYPVLMELGIHWRERRNPTKSAEYLLAALRVNSTPEVHNELGVLYGEIGDPATAARAFREALRLRPGWAVPAENLRRAEAALSARKAK
jgi:tetratricopeptide (TPR) repeat protein